MIHLGTREIQHFINGRSTGPTPWLIGDILREAVDYLAAALPPDRAEAILGDGAMLFGGMQPLWSLARYKAPVTVIVFNNRSYNNERNRIWVYTGGNQLKLGRDMTCYNGNPDVDFAKASIAFGVEAETVTDPDAIAGALNRAKRANMEGRPYLLDVVVQRYGVGWASTYYPEHSIAASRTRMV